MTLFGWLGEMITLNFIIVPGLAAKEADEQGRFIGEHFPKVFRMATVLALLAVIAAGGLTALGGLAALDRTLFLVGAATTGSLTAFHLAVESRLRPVALSLRTAVDVSKTRVMMRFLRIAPRIGIVVLTSGFAMIVLSVT